MQRQAKKAIIQEFAAHKGDTGSAQVQVAILTDRINTLTEHLKSHSKDKHSRKGLLGLVGARRKHLQYLERNQNEEYKKLIDKLGLRK